MTATAAPRSGWKVLTHDGRPPVQGGAIVWGGGLLPHDLPAVKLDTGEAECSHGWNYCERLSDALRIAGLWPTGRPAIALFVEASSDAVRRRDKCRASSLRLLRQATDEEIADAIRELSASAFGGHAAAMADEQIEWRRALMRPGRDAEAVESGLRVALTARGLHDWTLRRFGDARAAWDAWDAWAARDARAAWYARDARAAWYARAAWDARAARDARDARAAWDARAARDARDARDAWDAWAERDARAAWDAWDALTGSFAARQGWIAQPGDLLSRGLREAYAAGLEIAIPTGAAELGWAMAEARP
jgi:hypothetical protein